MNLKFWKKEKNNETLQSAGDPLRNDQRNAILPPVQATGTSGSSGSTVPPPANQTSPAVRPPNSWVVTKAELIPDPPGRPKVPPVQQPGRSENVLQRGGGTDKGNSKHSGMFNICAQCGFYHEANQFVGNDKAMRFNRYTAGELDIIFGKGNWSSSVLRMTACPSGKGPEVKKERKAELGKRRTA